MLLKRRPQQPAVQLLDLVLIELTNWRWTWRSMLLLGVVTPLSSMLAVKFLLSGMKAADIAYVYSGNVLLSLMFENQNRVADHFVFMRLHGTLDYFGSLPIRKLNLIISIAFAFVILSLPSVIVVIAAGAFLLDVQLRPHPALLLVVPLCSISMAGIGALTGALARTSSEATSLGLLITLLLSGMGAVIIPPDRLPHWITQLGVLSPATYASSALRQALLGPMTTIVTDLAVLIAFAAATFLAVAHTIDWRKEST